MQKSLCLLVLSFLVGIIHINAQSIASTDGTANCFECTPNGWSILTGTPDVSDRNFAATNQTSGGGTSWTEAPLPLPPNGHTNWLSLRDLGPGGVEEAVQTSITGLIIGETYELTLYSLTAIAIYSPVYNDSFSYQLGSQAIQTINSITQNSWGTNTITFTASNTSETFRLFPGSNSAGNPNYESVQISITQDAIVLVDVDSDNDGVPDISDVCNGFDDNADNDSDGIPDGCDEDDDNDGITDINESVNGQTVLWITDTDVDADELTSIQQLTNLGYSTTVVDHNNSEGIDFDDFDVIFVFEDSFSTTVLANFPGIENTTRGLVTTETQLYDDFFGASSGLRTSNSLINIINNNHPITSLIPLGNYDAGNAEAYVNNIATGTILGQHANGEASVVVWGAGEILENGSPANGRRALLPQHDDFNIAGADLITKTIVWASKIDSDNDGVIDELDNDSDDDGCFDALEGSSSFTLDNVDSEGRLLGGVNASTGIPLIAGTGQTDISSKDNLIKASVCIVDTDGDGIDDDIEVANGTNQNDSCDPVQNAGYTGFDGANTVWRAADCDNDGILNGDEFDNGTDPYSASGDTDGDGINDDTEIANGSDENNPCDPIQNAGYTGFDGANTAWREADCDNDGILNGDEFDNGTDPYSTSGDTDGDGIDDDIEVANGTNQNDPCDPVQNAGYIGFDGANTAWRAADCDNDGILNGDEFDNGTDPYSASGDTDGDGINDDTEIANSSDENNPCDPIQNVGYTGFDGANTVWREADCDNDGILNGDEFDNGTDPYAASGDTDGDGIDDDIEVANGTNQNDPCDPVQNAGYTGFDGANTVWREADCDNDGILNGDEFDNGTDPYSTSGDTDGDGIDDDIEVANGTNQNDPCDPVQNAGYTGFDGANTAWRAADCDNDGILNGDEFDNGTDPYSTSGDTDGDGIDDDIEVANGTNQNDPCDPIQNAGYTGFDGANTVWREADCDNDGILNGDEFDNGTDPYSTSGDTDGDGIDDDIEVANGTNQNDPCDPVQNAGYTGFNGANTVWRAADCDNDGILNGDEFDNGTDPYANPQDTDGDGISDDNEIASDFDPNNPCDPSQKSSYNGYNPNNEIWANADCDGDGFLNGEEVNAGTNPYAFDDELPSDEDFDGDGITDEQELIDGTDPEDSCDSIGGTPLPSDDCDNDGLTNAEELTGLDDELTEANPNGQTTNPENSDTDGDGIGDGQETINGTDPNDGCDSIGGTPPNPSLCDLGENEISIVSDLLTPDTGNGIFSINNIERFPNNSVKIFNRWGVKVFEATGYDNSNVSFRGISNARATIQKSEQLPTGVYYYLIEFESNNKRETITGYLYINR